MATKFQNEVRPRYGYSLANITADSLHIDMFGEGGISELLSHRMELIVPEPTNEDRKRHNLKSDEWDDGSQAACEYRDSFVPMMNYLWPVELSGDRGADYAADLMNRYAGATSLVCIDDNYYIALTGGGMNLSWHLAAAYVCCGCVPPLDLIDAIAQSPFRLSSAMNAEIVYAARDGVKWCRERSKKIADSLKATRYAIRQK